MRRRLSAVVALGLLAQLAALAPLVWTLAGGAPVPADLWRTGALVGLGGAALQAGALCALLALTLAAPGSPSRQLGAPPCRGLAAARSTPLED